VYRRRGVAGALARAGSDRYRQDVGTLFSIPHSRPWPTVRWTRFLPRPAKTPGRATGTGMLCAEMQHPIRSHRRASWIARGPAVNSVSNPECPLRRRSVPPGARLFGSVAAALLQEVRSVTLPFRSGTRAASGAPALHVLSLLVEPGSSPRWSDVVVGDYTTIFDARRFGSVGTSRTQVRVCLLVDEAHSRWSSPDHVHGPLWITSRWNLCAGKRPFALRGAF